MDQRNISTNPAASAFDQEWQERFAARRTTVAGSTCTGVEILERIRARRGDELNQLLLELLGSAQQGDELARRALLQTMLPKGIRIARTSKALRHLPHTDAIHTAMGAMYQAVAEYPTDRWHTSVGANLSFLAIRILTKMNPCEEEQTGLEDYELEMLVDHELQPEPHAFRAVVKVLSWALDSQTLSAEEVKVLANFELGDRKERAELVERLGTTREALRKRALRLRSKLATAIADTGFEL